jgi:hypothetical protein
MTGDDHDEPYFTAEDLLMAQIRRRPAPGFEDWDLMAEERQADRLAAMTPPAEPRRRVRRPSLAAQLRVIKAAEKAGLPIRRAVVDGARSSSGLSPRERRTRT